MVGEYQSTLAQRVLSKTDREAGYPVADRPELGVCWPWTGAKNTDGYGVVRGDVEWPDSTRKQPLLLAHRVALSLALGRPIREGMFANHHCDNPGCVRPRHLYEGTSQDNVNDMNERGRAVKPPIRRRAQLYG